MFTEKFIREILSYGNIKYYDGEKIQAYKCINKSLSNPENYRCFQLETFWKIVKKFDESEEIINYFKKKGLKDNINLPSSIIYQFPTYNLKLFNYYEFPKIEEAALIDKSITEYDIPQYIPDIPEGFSIFCTLWEASRVRQFLELNKEGKNNNDNIQNKENESNECDNCDINEEPIPKTNFCHLCMRKFDDYNVHIKTLIHKNNIIKNPLIINRAKNTFEKINNFWSKKEKEHIPDNKYLSIEKNEKPEHTRINSLSSFSSSASTLRFDESISGIKSISSFLLDQDLIESERIKNKENIDDNNTKKTKNKNIFNTPKNKSECKFGSYLSSSQSDIHFFLNKKRKPCLDEEKNNKGNKVDYFRNLNTKKIKRLIRSKDVFFK